MYEKLPMNKVLEATFNRAQEAYDHAYNEDHTPKIPYPEEYHNEITRWGRAWLVCLTVAEHLEGHSDPGDLPIADRLNHAYNATFDDVLTAMYG